MLGSKNFSDLVTFTRASARWRFSSGGLLVQDAANVPSLDFDPSTLAARGLLVEEQRTNRMFPSVYAGSGWTTVASGVASVPVITANAAVAPDGSATAARVDFALNGGTSATDFSSLNLSAVSYTNAVTDTASIWLRTVDGSTKVFRFLTPDGAVVQAITVTGVWARFVVTSTPISSSSGSTRLRLRGGEGTADSASVNVWGGQLEAGAFAGGYIATTTAQATRAGDSATISDLSKLGFNQSAGTIVAEIIVPADASSPRGLWQFDAGTSTDRHYCYIQSGAIYVGTLVASAAQAAWSIAAPAAGSVLKVAYAYANNDFALSINGGAVLTDSAGSLPTVSGLSIGSLRGANLLNSWVRRFNYVPLRKTNAELPTLSA